MYKTKTLVIIFLALFPMFAFSQKPPKPELLLRTRMNSEKGTENLVSVGNSRYQILFMDYREADKQILNIYTPYAAIGRISSHGLLREIRNPAAHNPGSQIFRERTRIAPDRRLRSTGNSGVRLDAGNLLSGFIEEGESRFSYLAWKGLYSTHLFGKNALINIAATEYYERDDSNRNIWYSDRKNRYGREVTNIAASASYGTRKYGISGAGSVCFYKGADNGLYFRLSPYVRYSFIRLDFLVSGTNEDYIRPDGALSSTAFRKGVAATMTPAPWLRINCRYVTDILHKKESDIRYGGYTEELFGSIVFRPWFFESGASVRYRDIYRDNNFNNYINTTAFIGVRTGFGKIVFEKRDTFEDYEKISQTYRLEAGAWVKNVNFYMLWRLRDGVNEKEIHTTARVRVRIKNVSLFSEYKTTFIERQNRPNRNLAEYTIGLDARF
ncbi:MAG: hypothetical protein FWC36_07520 [Spirochaetes bacterium]|nr:hypothetical protein [Spirochaetota bacterium]